jgi:hypothetical protein
MSFHYILLIKGSPLIRAHGLTAFNSSRAIQYPRPSMPIHHLPEPPPMRARPFPGDQLSPAWAYTPEFDPIRESCERDDSFV